VVIVVLAMLATLSVQTMVFHGGPFPLAHAAAHTTDYVHTPQSIKSFSPGGQYVVLSFSNGPHHSFTAQVLDILLEFKTKASFFVYGQRALHHPDAVRRIVREGHDLGQQGFHIIPHSWSALAFSRASAATATDSIRHTSDLLLNLTGTRTQFFRAPFEEISADIESKVVLQDQFLHSIHWSLDSHDRNSVNRQGVTDAQTVVDHVAQNVKPGDVVLFHDTQHVLVEALPAILRALIKAGYEIVTLSDILNFPDDSPH
jgi:peptidoglycan-N-acetylglucosamine deacetylase